MCVADKWLILKSLVGAAGLEPAALGLEIRCSIRLSYAPRLLYPPNSTMQLHFPTHWYHRL